MIYCDHTKHPTMFNVHSLNHLWNWKCQLETSCYSSVITNFQIGRFYHSDASPTIQIFIIVWKIIYILQYDNNGLFDRLNCTRMNNSIDVMNIFIFLLLTYCNIYDSERMKILILFLYAGEQKKTFKINIYFDIKWLIFESFSFSIIFIYYLLNWYLELRVENT